MSGASIGALLGRRKSPLDPLNPTDPVRAHSWDVDDPKASPGKRVGDGTPQYGWAFCEGLRFAARALFSEHRREGYDGPHRMQRFYLPVITAILKHLDFKTGDLTPCYKTIAEAAEVHPNTAKRAVACFEYWGLIAHVRRSVRVERAAEEPGPRRKQTSNAYFFDCRRRMSADLWGKFWSRVIFNLKKVSALAARKAAVFNRTFNEVAKQAPRPTDSPLAALLARIEREHFSAPASSGASTSASP